MISVCMPTFNGEKFIQQQIDSILNQIDMDDELIISDDSSTDKTIEIIKSYEDKRIKLIENQTFHSPIYNLENALKQVQGEFILLADQDDIWYPNKVKTILDHMKTYDLVVSDCQLIDEDNKVLADSFFDLIHSGPGFIKNWIKNTYLGCCMAFNRKVLDAVLPFPKGIAIHDHWIGLNAELYSSVYFCNKQLLGYRKHENNQTPFTGGRSKHSLRFKVTYRLEMLFLIFKRAMKRKWRKV